jgi:hypothetical protein
MPIANDKLPKIAGLELNALRAAGVLGDDAEGLRIGKTATPIYDPNGAVLFIRLGLSRGRTTAGYADFAVQEALGEPLLAVAVSAVWEPKLILEQGQAAARKARRSLRFDSIRFVAYSFPKLALQFLLGAQEVLMLELFTWAPVPPARTEGRKRMEPENFERFSLLDELPAADKRRRAQAFRRRVARWEALRTSRLDLSVISKAALEGIDFGIRLVDQRELHYSTRDTDHAPCYELRGQQTNVWCVAASTEMLLNFYRYTYDQVRIASELGLGTLASPSGLPYARDGDVVTVIEDLSSKSLNATMLTAPPFSTYRNEIRANRPLISFIPGHSRSVAGYTRTLWQVNGFTGLLVYDPWPPNAGVITRWENFATQTYRRAFTAVLKHV